MPHLKFTDLKEAKVVLKELRDLRLTIRIRTLSTNVSPRELTFSDVTFNVSRLHPFGQKGISTGLRFWSDKSQDDYFHMISWHIKKKRRVN